MVCEEGLALARAWEIFLGRLGVMVPPLPYTVPYTTVVTYMVPRWLWRALDQVSGREK